MWLTLLCNIGCGLTYSTVFWIRCIPGYWNTDVYSFKGYLFIHSTGWFHLPKHSSLRNRIAYCTPFIVLYDKILTFLRSGVWSDLSANFHRGQPISESQFIVQMNIKLDLILTSIALCSISLYSDSGSQQFHISSQRNGKTQFCVTLSKNLLKTVRRYFTSA